MTPTCELCWTSSFAPVPTETECQLVHPHDGVHARCSYCDLMNEYRRLHASLTKLVLAVGDDPTCAKLTVSCTCGKAALLTAAHAEAAYLVRSIQEVKE